jgi:hypothetical protein
MYCGKLESDYLMHAGSQNKNAFFPGSQRSRGRILSRLRVRTRTPPPGYAIAWLPACTYYIATAEDASECTYRFVII